MNTKNEVKLATIDSTNKFDGQYFLFPKYLIKENLENLKRELSIFEAFLMIILNVKYADQTEKVGLESRICRRGETFKSLQAWSDLFNWNRSTTRRYFQKMSGRGWIEWESLVNTTRIKIVNYDFYVGHNDPQSKLKYTPEFETFWKEYHQMTSRQMVDKVVSYRFWRMLSLSERDLAVKNMRKYYYNLSNTTYCVKALTYLRNKKFNDQFYSKC